jgi:hypothetical protein
MGGPLVSVLWGSFVSCLGLAVDSFLCRSWVLCSTVGLPRGAVSRKAWSPVNHARYALATECQVRETRPGPESCWQQGLWHCTDQPHLVTQVPTETP